MNNLFSDVEIFFKGGTRISIYDVPPTELVNLASSNPSATFFCRLATETETYFIRTSNIDVIIITKKRTQMPITSSTYYVTQPV